MASPDDDLLRRLDAVIHAHEDGLQVETVDKALLREARARIAQMAQKNDRLSNDIDAFNRTEHDQTGAAMVWHDLYQETCKRAEQAEAQLRETQEQLTGLNTDYGQLLAESNGYEVKLRAAEARVRELEGK